MPTNIPADAVLPTADPDDDDNYELAFQIIAGWTSICRKRARPPHTLNVKLPVDIVSCKYEKPLNLISKKPGRYSMKSYLPGIHRRFPRTHLKRKRCTFGSICLAKRMLPKKKDKYLKLTTSKPIKRVQVAMSVTAVTWLLQKQRAGNLLHQRVSST